MKTSRECSYVDLGDELDKREKTDWRLRVGYRSQKSIRLINKICCLKINGLCLVAKLVGGLWRYLIGFKPVFVQNFVDSFHMSHQNDSSLIDIWSVPFPEPISLPTFHTSVLGLV